MKPIQSILAIVLLVALSACSDNSVSNLIGDWHVAGTDRYLAIKNDDGEYTVKLYGPPVGSVKRVRSKTFPATLEDGILVINMPEGNIPILYNPNTKTILLNAKWEYAKLPVES